MAMAPAIRPATAAAAIPRTTDLDFIDSFYRVPARWRTNGWRMEQAKIRGTTWNIAFAFAFLYKKSLTILFIDPILHSSK
jgi:hypothetical protein